MPALLSMLENTLVSIAADKAQSAVKDHILKAVDDNLDEEGKKMLDDAIDKDTAHGFKKLADMF